VRLKVRKASNTLLHASWQGVRLRRPDHDMSGAASALQLQNLSGAVLEEDTIYQGSQTLVVWSYVCHQ
jgi:hypothetical protein